MTTHNTVAGVQGTGTTLASVFNNAKITENGDLSYKSTGNHYADLLFMSEYFTHNPGEAEIGTSEFDQIFSMMVRDPRFGLGMRDYGRELMAKSGVSAKDTVLAGRFDDLIFPTPRFLDFIKSEIEGGNALAKKWMPRFGSKNKAVASKIAKSWKMSKQEYGKFVKVETTERQLTEKRTDAIKFEQVPSLASIKYAKRFSHGADTKERYAEFISAVKNGKAKLNVATTSVYDIYKNRHTEGFDTDLFFSKIEKIALNAIAIVDTSGSMNSFDAMGKALAIGHYIAKCSTYMPNHVIEFSARPHLIELGKGFVAQVPSDENRYGYRHTPTINENDSQYNREIDSMITGDCSNTNFGAVLELLSMVSKDNMPEYLVVLTDMEFDNGSHRRKVEMQQAWAAKGITTKLVWWNFNGRNKTVPETDSMGNLYLSGYNPILLKYLESGFNSTDLINKLVEEYRKKIGK